MGWASGCRLGGLGGGLPPCTRASWLVLKRWLKITLIVWELLLQRGWLWPPRGPRRQELVPPTSLGSRPLGAMPSWPQLCLLPTSSRETWRAGWATPSALSFWRLGTGLCAWCCLLCCWLGQDCWFVKERRAGTQGSSPSYSSLLGSQTWCLLTSLCLCPSAEWADPWVPKRTCWQLRPGV